MSILDIFKKQEKIDLSKRYFDIHIKNSEIAMDITERLVCIAEHDNDDADAFVKIGPNILEKMIKAFPVEIMAWLINIEDHIMVRNGISVLARDYLKDILWNMLKKMEKI